MDVKRILNYLAELSANNNREWYQAHKDEYTACRTDFEAGVKQALAAISLFDGEISHLQVKDCVYRFNRDTRFSADKSPYIKTTLGLTCAPRVKRLCAVVTIYTWSKGIVFWPWVVIGCPLISSLRAAMR